MSKSPETASLPQIQDATLAALSLLRDEAAGLFARHGSEPSPLTQTLKMLFAYLSERGQAISFLVSWGYAWDAEIILRSYYETAARILFICHAEPDEKLKLIDEFWNGIGNINDRKRALKANFAERLFRGTDSDSVPIFTVLQDPTHFETAPTGSKAERKALEQKWSFSEIIHDLERKARNGRPLNHIQALLHNYGIASHLIHADQGALDLMTDRELREPEERKILEAAHTCRIFSDQVSLWFFCAEALRFHFGGEFQDRAQLDAAYNSTVQLSKPILDAFHVSQREFYERMVPNNDDGMHT